MRINKSQKCSAYCQVNHGGISYHVITSIRSPWNNDLSKTFEFASWTIRLIPMVVKLPYFWLTTPSASGGKYFYAAHLLDCSYLLLNNLFEKFLWDCWSPLLASQRYQSCAVARVPRTLCQQLYFLSGQIHTISERAVVAWNCHQAASCELTL